VRNGEGTTDLGHGPDAPGGQEVTLTLGNPNIIQSILPKQYLMYYPLLAMCGGKTERVNMPVCSTQHFMKMMTKAKRIDCQSEFGNQIKKFLGYLSLSEIVLLYRIVRNRL